MIFYPEVDIYLPRGFLLFKEIMYLVRDRQHLTTEGRLRIEVLVSLERRNSKV
jgi:hypothetical protein